MNPHSNHNFKDYLFAIAIVQSSSNLRLSSHIHKSPLTIKRGLIRSVFARALHPCAGVLRKKAQVAPRRRAYCERVYAAFYRAKAEWWRRARVTEKCVGLGQVASPGVNSLYWHQAELKLLLSCPHTLKRHRTHILFFTQNACHVSNA